MRILIVGPGNSAWSQMAEGLLRFGCGARWEVASAGVLPSGVRPEAIAVMLEIGIDISGHRSKPLDEFAGSNFDYLVTVCDTAVDVSVFPAWAERIHWSLEDPAVVAGNSEERLAAFRRIRDQIGEQVAEFYMSWLKSRHKKILDSSGHF